MSCCCVVALTCVKSPSAELGILSRFLVGVGRLGAGMLSEIGVQRPGS